MFTGIIQDIGEIVAIDKKGDWNVTIKTAALPLDKMALGASVACGGVCLTIIEKSKTEFRVQVSMETLGKTVAAQWKVGQRINLEPALRAGDELGGHLLSGHVDGVAKVTGRTPESDSLRYQFEVPQAFVRFLAPKGSVAIDGVSLTVNEVEGTRFGINIIPHTQGMTTLAALNVGDTVNFEIDMIARYVERMLNARIAA
jgi:riboflavin synthase